MHPGSANRGTRAAWVGKLALALVLTALASFLLARHGAHLYALLPWLLLLACPLMHLLHHRGHGAHRGHHGGRPHGD
jgi:thiol:disulfide interchange protein